MVRLKLRATVAVAGAALLALAGCTTHKTEAPSLTGPSELGTSVTIEVSPDVLAQDGASQSLVTVTVRDSNGQPLRNVAMRASITIDGVVTDFGTLSAKNLVSDTAGRATVVYTAPPAPPINVDTGTVVTIDITPTGTNFANTVANHVASIRLVPPGTVGAPASPLRPGFVPPSATAGDAAVFSATVVDAAGNDASSQVASYTWTFGDGSTASGRSVSHTYSSAGSYPVTLRIVDAQGRIGQTVQSLTVSGGTNPTASFFISPSPPNVGQSVTFNASTSVAAPGHTITSYAWDFGDGSQGGGATTTHAFAAAGSYTVLLTTTDDVGRKGTSTQTIAVGAGGLTADFNFSPSQPAVGQSINFDGSLSKASSGRTIRSYAWDFDDGTTGSGVQTSHSYNRTGSFVARLTITDDLGNTATVTKSVPVGGAAPAAAFTFSPTSPQRGQTVNFDASQSRAGTGRTITNYAWNFDDGAIAFGVTTVHSFSNSGTFNVRLTITDDIGQTATVTQPVTVAVSVAMTADFTFLPASPSPGQPVTFDGSTSRPATGRTITAYSWNFDDGTTGSGVTTSHPFAQARTYNVRLTVTDDAGQTATTSKSVPVTSVAPTARFTFLPQSPVTNQVVNFDASTSTVGGPGRTIVSYAWDFGDSATAANVTTSHSYANPGNYVVRLTVTDDLGQTNTANQTVTVSTGVTAIFEYSPTSPNVGQPVFFDARQSFAPAGRTIVDYSWTWGDGTPAGSGQTTSHTFGAANSYVVRLTVTDDTGRTGTTSQTVTIK